MNRTTCKTILSQNVEGAVVIVITVPRVVEAERTTSAAVIMVETSLGMISNPIISNNRSRKIKEPERRRSERPILSA